MHCTYCSGRGCRVCLNTGVAGATREDLHRVEKSDTIELPENFFDLHRIAIKQLARDIAQEQNQLIIERMNEIDPGVNIIECLDRFELHKTSRVDDQPGATIINYKKPGSEDVIHVITFYEAVISKSVSGHEYHLNADLQYE